MQSSIRTRLTAAIFLPALLLCAGQTSHAKETQAKSAFTKADLKAVRGAARGDARAQKTEEIARRLSPLASLTCEALAAEFKADRAGATARYSNAVVEISGKVKSIKLNPSTKMTVMEFDPTDGSELSLNERFRGVPKATFSSKHADKLKELSTGDDVTVRGLFTSLVGLKLTGAFIPSCSTCEVTAADLKAIRKAKVGDARLKATEALARKVTPLAELTSEAMAAAFKADREGAKARYTNQVIQLTAKVKKIGQHPSRKTPRLELDPTDDRELTLNERFRGIPKVNFSSAHRKAIDKLKVGDVIVVRGLVQEKIGLHLNGAYFVADAQKPMKVKAKAATLQRPKKRR